MVASEPLECAPLAGARALPMTCSFHAGPADGDPRARGMLDAQRRHPSRHGDRLIRGRMCPAWVIYAQDGRSLLTSGLWR